MKLKKRIYMAALLVALLSFSLVSAAQAAPKVILNGKQLSFEVPPTIENGRTLVPVRAIFEALGADVSWEGATKTVTAKKAGTVVKLQIGVKTAYKNGLPLTLDVPAKIIDNRTLGPLRFVSEALGAKVEWLSSTQTIKIDSIGEQPALAPVEGLTADEQKMFELVNKERAAQGLKQLKIDMELIKLARMKSQDMVNLGYFDHNSPTYGSPFDMLRAYGIHFTYAGENLAGAPEVNSAHLNLMNSPGHRANILNPEYTHVGIGIIEGSQFGKIFTQMFIRK